LFADALLVANVNVDDYDDDYVDDYDDDYDDGVSHRKEGL